MVNAKPKSVMRAAALASVLTLGIVVPAGSGPMAGSEPARDAWKYPESASLAGFLEDIVILPGRGARAAASAKRGPVMLDQVIHRAALTGDRDNSDLTSLGPTPRATWLEFGLGAKTPSGRQNSASSWLDSLVPVSLFPTADSSRRREVMRDFARATVPILQSHGRSGEGAGWRRPFEKRSSSR